MGGIGILVGGMSPGSMFVNGGRATGLLLLIPPPIIDGLPIMGVFQFICCGNNEPAAVGSIPIFADELSDALFAMVEVG